MYRKYTGLAIIAAVLFAGCTHLPGLTSLPAAPEPFLIAENGVTPMKIVVSESAPEPTRHAAQELRHFLKEITGADLQVVDDANLKMRVWERGSGETWACGTGTCATVAALTELGICPAGEDVHVQLRGGELTIRVLPGKQLLMTGAAETVCEGTTEA